jgi:hypothetical protein
MAKNRGLPEERGPSGRATQGAGASESTDLSERNNKSDAPPPKKAAASPTEKKQTRGGKT